MLSKSAAVDLVKATTDPWRNEKTRLEGLWAWYKGNNPEPYLPKAPDRGMRLLRDKCRSPHLRKVVRSITQELRIDGYRPTDASGNSAPWTAWQANRMDSGQVGLFRTTVALGYAYQVVLPGVPEPVISTVAARSMYAEYAEDGDEFPMHAVQYLRSGDGWAVRLYDEECLYYLGIEANGETVWIDADEHGMGVCPVVRYTAPREPEERPTGEVEPYVGLAARIDQTTMDRLVVQRYGSWKVRTVAGMAKPETDEEERAAKRILEVGDLLVSGSSDTKFGTLDETPLAGFIAAKEADLAELAAVSQTPAFDLLGKVANLSAEALDAARMSHDLVVGEYRLSLGESAESMMRLVGAAQGDPEAAADVASQVVWGTSQRSIAQAADAAVKYDAIGVPLRMLFEMMPGWTQQDVDRAMELVGEQQAAEAATAARSFGLTGVTADATSVA